jgi:hypothetical protein
VPETQGDDHGDDDDQRVLGAQQPEQRKRERGGEQRTEEIEHAPPDMVRQPTEQRNGHDLDQRGDENRIKRSWQATCTFV